MIDSLHTGPDTALIDHGVWNNTGHYEERPYNPWEQTSSPINQAYSLSLLGVGDSQNSWRTSSAVIFLTKDQPDEIQWKDLGVKEIKTSLGLNLSQLSSILNCSRPQLYKWIDGNIEPKKTETLERMRVISESLSTISPDHAELFGSYSKRYVSKTETLLEKLSKPNLTTIDVISLYKAIKPIIEARLSNKDNTSNSSKNGKIVALDTDLPTNG